MSGRQRFERIGGDWPYRTHSRFVQAAGFTWHVQVMGTGPVLLLLHGTGAATHSWRGLIPALRERFTLVAPDLPGHGFTDLPHRDNLSLPGMASAVTALLERLEIEPEIGVGHSAGAAVLAQMCLDRQIAPRQLVSINGALLPLHGWAAETFGPAARLLARSRALPSLVSWRAGKRKSVGKLIDGTGSSIDPLGVELYRRLVRDPVHVRGALTMMAQWDLKPFARRLRQLETPLTLVVATQDKAVPASDALQIQAQLPSARIVKMQGLGHLAHEERPDEVARLILELAQAGEPVSA